MALIDKAPPALSLVGSKSVEERLHCTDTDNFGIAEPINLYHVLIAKGAIGACGLNLRRCRALTISLSLPFQLENSSTYFLYGALSCR